MKRAVRLTGPVLGLVFLAAWMTGCEDTDVLAPGDGSIIVSANPATLVVDLNEDPAQASTILRAQVLDAGGRPQPEVVVSFSTDGGSLASGGVAIKSNTAGVAQDTLTVVESDPDAITVTVRSGLVTGVVGVVKTVLACNTAPSASAGGNQTVNGDEFTPVPVVLDGRGSSDLETPRQEMLYVWTCGNGDVPVQEPTLRDPRVVVCEYLGAATVSVSYTATLTVFDTGNGVRIPGTQDYECQLADTDSVTITVN